MKTAKDVLREAYERSAIEAKVCQVTLYRVEFNYDTTEGRGGAYYEYYLSQDVANHRAKGNYVMGSDCPVKIMTEQVIITDDERVFRFGDCINIKYEDPRIVKARALAKLTPEEQDVLGISDKKNRWNDY